MDKIEIRGVTGAGGSTNDLKKKPKGPKTSLPESLDSLKGVLADLASIYSPTIARAIRGGQASRQDLINLLNTLRSKNAIDTESKNRVLGQLQALHQAIRSNRSGSASMQRAGNSGVQDKIKQLTNEIVKNNTVQQAMSNAEDIAQRIGTEYTVQEATEMMEPYAKIYEERIKIN